MCSQACAPCCPQALPSTDALPCVPTPGTPRYMAPELLLEDQPYSCEIDIWSLGAVIYWLCAGKEARPEAPDLPTLKVRGTPSPV
eukprot:2069227-Pyramimonas_sp.AAC.2